MSRPDHRYVLGIALVAALCFSGACKESIELENLPGHVTSVGPLFFDGTVLTVQFTTRDEEGDRIDVTAEFRVADGAWSDVPTNGDDDDPLSGLANAIGEDTPHVFRWDLDRSAGVDRNSELTLRITPVERAEGAVTHGPFVPADLEPPDTPQVVDAGNDTGDAEDDTTDGTDAGSDANDTDDAEDDTTDTATDATDTATDATDTGDAEDDTTDTATDATDTGDATGDTTDAADATDTTDAADATDATDTTDAADATDATDAADTDDATDTADATDAADVSTETGPGDAGEDGS